MSKIFIILMFGWMPRVKVWIQPVFFLLEIIYQCLYWVGQVFSFLGEQIIELRWKIYNMKGVTQKEGNATVNRIFSIIYFIIFALLVRLIL